MAIAPSIETYLSKVHVNYDLVMHAVTDSALHSAQAAHVPTSNVVKAILLKDQSDEGYVMAAIPASNKLRVAWVNVEIGRHLVLAGENELRTLFPDCVLGAIPGFGQAYNLDLIWDDQLEQQRELYFEAGNHQELIHISKKQFIKLFRDLPHSVISLPADSFPLFGEKYPGLN
jgi:Ala-tRNA(Pro) deacylase